MVAGNGVRRPRAAHMTPVKPRPCTPNTNITLLRWSGECLSIDENTQRAVLAVRGTQASGARPPEVGLWKLYDTLVQNRRLQWRSPFWPSSSFDLTTCDCGHSTFCSFPRLGGKPGAEDETTYHRTQISIHLAQGSHLWGRSSFALALRKEQEKSGSWSGRPDPFWVRLGSWVRPAKLEECLIKFRICQSEILSRYFFSCGSLVGIGSGRAVGGGRAPERALPNSPHAKAQSSPGRPILTGLFS
jgi:hypothetical protein